MNERLSLIQALIRESVAKNNFACEDCGNPVYKRIIVFELTEDKTGKATSILTKCEPCIERDGGFTREYE